jgi:hypothetical protein
MGSTDGKRVSNVELSNSWTRTLLLVRQSFDVMGRDKRLIFFPVAAAFSALCVSVSFVRPLIENGAVDRYMKEGRVDGQTVLWLFLWYYFHFFVILFFNCALTSATNDRMAGRNPSVISGVLAAVDRLFPISMWTLVASTAGICLRLFEGRSKWLARLVTKSIGLTWIFATYFVGPVLMFEEASILPALKRSAQVTRKIWRERLTNQASFGLFTLLFAIPGIVLATAGIFFNHALLVPAFLYALILSVILSAARTIFTVALYRYAITGKIPPGFCAGIIPCDDGVNSTPEAERVH